MNENLSILVVDDEKPILDIFKQFLDATTNHTVFTANNGAEAVEIITREKIDCCFLDLSMPVMDGIELAKRIHLHDNTIPMAVMTGYPTIDNVIKTLKNGVVDFLNKPIKMAQIPLTINRMMRDKSLLAENILLQEEAKKNEKLLKVNNELQQKVNEVEIMNLILRKLDQVGNSKDLFNILVKLSGQITVCDEAHCSILFSETSDYTTLASFFRDPGTGAANPGSIKSDIVKRVADDGIPIIVNGNNGSGNIMGIPLKIRENILGVLLLVIKNSEVCFQEKDLYFMNFIAEKASYVIENLALYENIFQNLFSTLYAFVETIEARDSYTKQHSIRVSRYAISIAKAMGCSQEEQDALNVAGSLHDIGKIGIPDNILLKPGRLSDEEYEIIKKHPVIANNIIGHFDMWADELKIIRHHHERFDGYGYPDGLKGEEIPFLSRILSIADVYDALITDRSYRKKMSDDQAISIIRESSGTQFDPEIADFFLDLHGRGKNMFQRKAVEAAQSA
jgi:putative nucleotidyltransferase with HDIG domain